MTSCGCFSFMAARAFRAGSRRRLQALAGSAVILAGAIAAAETVTIDGVVSNDPSGWYFAGDTTSVNRLIITNAGVLAVSNATIGNAVVATGNVALVTGAGSLLTNRGWLIIGSNASDNVLHITNGGWVISSNAVAGFEATANSNRIFIAGPGAVWSNLSAAAEFLLIGRRGGWNELQVLNGGSCYHNGSVLLGRYAGASNNAAVVSGSGSLLSARNHVVIGAPSDAAQPNGNSLRVENGGQVRGGGCLFIGNSVFAAENNAVRVNGAGSGIAFTDYISVGYNAARKGLLAVENGGQAYSSTKLIVGYWCNSNTCLIDGAGSAITNMDTSLIGQAGGDFNAVIVRNGGWWYNPRAIIGGYTEGLSHSNRVTVCDPGSVWSNLYRLTIGGAGGCLGNGLIISNGGLVTVGSEGLYLNYGFISNYISGRSGGLALVTNAGVYVGTGSIHIAFTSKPASNGFYWGLRWAGNHTNELNALHAATQLTWNADEWQTPIAAPEVSVWYDTTNTYVGAWFFAANATLVRFY